MHRREEMGRVLKFPITVKRAEEDINELMQEYQSDENMKITIFNEMWNLCVNMFTTLDVVDTLRIDYSSVYDFLRSSLDDFHENTYTMFRSAKGSYLYVFSFMGVADNGMAVTAFYRIGQDGLRALRKLDPEELEDKEVKSEIDTFVWEQLPPEMEKATEQAIGLMNESFDDFDTVIGDESAWAEDTSEEADEQFEKFMDTEHSWYQPLIDLHMQCSPNTCFEVLHKRDDLGLFSVCLVPSSKYMYGTCIMQDRDGKFSVCQVSDPYMRNRLNGKDSCEDDGRDDQARTVRSGLSFEEACTFINENFNDRGTVKPKLIVPSENDVIYIDLGRKSEMLQDLSGIITMQKNSQLPDGSGNNEKIRSCEYMMSVLKED